MESPYFPVLLTSPLLAKLLHPVFWSAWNVLCKSDIENWKKIQTLTYGHGFALCADFVRIGSILLLATGHDDCSVRLHVAAFSDLYSKDLAENSNVGIFFFVCFLNIFYVSRFYFKYITNFRIFFNFFADFCKIFQVFKSVEVLRGHENWVQSLSFSSRYGDYCFLASGAQDTYVRVWRFDCGIRSNASNSIPNGDEVSSDAAISLRPRYLPASVRPDGAGKILAGYANESKGWGIRDPPSGSLQRSSPDRTFRRRGCCFWPR